MVVIRRLLDWERPALRQFWAVHWGAEIMVVHDKTFHVDQLDAFLALDKCVWLGVVTFSIDASLCEVLSLDSLRAGQGIGTVLLRAVEQDARQAGCDALKLFTTNDNTRALRFYQKFGFELTALYPHAVDAARKLKPSIPECGDDGIPIRDEIELQLRLAPLTS